MNSEQALQIQTVGVVGCGLMGAGIVEICARSGFSVVVSEVSQEALHAGLGRLRKSLDRGLDKGKLSKAEHAEALDRVRGTTDLEDLSDCDLVIEAVVESLEVKRQLFARLDEITEDHAILASNTSSISITKLAAATDRPEQVIGAHFFNPVPVMPLLEIVRGMQTSEACFETLRAFGAALGKQIVVALKDNPGFIVNLLFVPYGLDAIRGLEQGVATKEDFDTAMRLGMNHPMGPFELMDFVGLDTMLFIADAMYAETLDPRYAAPPRLRQMVAADMLGRKSGRGFYDYG
ncbi:MAG: 3-hydroxybutyryl-CoA dehydrogenase [Caldilineae bacterium]|nr:3-hydroxybutyryl-CoA dehydrogenase [Chloroflexota bacterium]MCB9175804.1 3-hydroxybutyryl-CoA dehydrogenase [Caldilineae bacterium]